MKIASPAESQTLEQEFDRLGVEFARLQAEFTELKHRPFSAGEHREFVAEVADFRSRMWAFETRLHWSLLSHTRESFARSA